MSGPHEHGWLALETDRERVLVLLSVVCRTPVAASLIPHIEAAAGHWQGGDRALANLRLVFSGLTRLDDPGNADRLRLAAYCLDHGMSPQTLMKELGLDPTPLGLRKYDPDQPRNPACSGRVSGQWTKGSTGQSSSTYAPVLLAARAPSLVDPLGAEALTWLGRLAGRLALPVALFGAAFIPSPNGAVTEEGPVPGRSDLTYGLDHDTGILRLSTNHDTDPTHALVAQLGADGVYHDIDTGVAIARAVGAGTVLIDLDRAGVVSQAPATDQDHKTDDDQPKLCPAPIEDQPGGRKLFDVMYEQYVRDTVNPQRNPQLPPGLTFALPGATTSGWVHFDDCREADGTMIEAKGNYAEFLATPIGEKRFTEGWLDQAGKQVRASQGAASNGISTMLPLHPSPKGSLPKQATTGRSAYISCLTQAGSRSPTRGSDDALLFLLDESTMGRAGGGVGGACRPLPANDRRDPAAPPVARHLDMGRQSGGLGYGGERG